MTTAGRLFVVCSWLIVLPATTATAAAAGSEQPRLAERHPETMRSLRWRGIVRQTYDFSCGAGSIANLIILIGGKAPDEQALINEYIQTRGKEAVQETMRDGFSLFDLKLMLQSAGYETAGVRYEAGTMPEDPQPMIVYLVVKGYRHFAVFAGIEQGQVLLLDPSRGRIRITKERFLAEWDGTALCFAGDEERGTVPVDDVGLTRGQETARSAVFRLRR